MLFSGPGDALKAVEKLHAHVFKGGILSVTLKKRVEALTRATDSKKQTAVPSRGSRLIVRNLPWNVRGNSLLSV